MGDKWASGELIFESIKVKKKSPLAVERARVPGAWLVVVYLFPMTSFKTASVTYYPDPGHEWDGGSLLEIAQAEIEQSDNPFFGREKRK